MWVKRNGFSYKNMAYFNSCFPCSVHVVLANLGYLTASGQQIEDLWNRFHGDLNRTAPNEREVHSYLQRTDDLAGRGVLYTPTSFADRKGTERIAERLKRDFMGSGKAVGMVAGLGHAEVFFRTRKGTAYHFRPSPDIDSCIFEEIKPLGIRVLEAPGPNGGTEYAIGLDYRIAGGHEEVHAAHFAFVLS